MGKQYGKKLITHQIKKRKVGDNMDEVFIRTWTLPEWLAKKYFKNQDFVSVDDLIAIIEDLDSDLENLQEKYEDFKQDVEDNYKPLSIAEQVGISDRDFLC